VSIIKLNYFPRPVH